MFTLAGGGREGRGANSAAPEKGRIVIIQGGWGRLRLLSRPAGGRRSCRLSIVRRAARLCGGHYSGLLRGRGGAETTEEAPLSGRKKHGRRGRRTVSLTARAAYRWYRRGPTPTARDEGQHFRI